VDTPQPAISTAITESTNVLSMPKQAADLAVLLMLLVPPAMFGVDSGGGGAGGADRYGHGQ